MTRQTGMMAPPGRLRIDLDAVAANWRKLDALAPSAGVVKADAYGLGMDRVAPGAPAGGLPHILRGRAGRGGGASRPAARCRDRRAERARRGLPGALPRIPPAAGAEPYERPRRLAGRRRRAAYRHRHDAARPRPLGRGGGAGTQSLPAGDEPPRLRRRAGARAERGPAPPVRGACRPVRRAGEPRKLLRHLPRRRLPVRPRPARHGAVRPQPDTGRAQPDAPRRPAGGPGAPGPRGGPAPDGRLRRHGRNPRRPGAGHGCRRLCGRLSTRCKPRG